MHPPSPLNPFRYRGYLYDNETGLYFLQTRFYDPYVKRFLNADSLFIAGDVLTGTSMYAYCNGNPVMYSDPTGRAPGLAEAIALGALVAAAFALLTKAGASEQQADTIIRGMANAASDIYGLLNALEIFVQDFDPTDVDSSWFDDIPEEEMAAFYGGLGGVLVTAGASIVAVLSGGAAVPIIVLILAAAGGAASGYYGSLLEQLFESIFG